MALEITYIDRADHKEHKVYGICVGRATVTLGASSATCGTVPGGAAIARLTAGEACTVSNNGAAADATNGFYLAANTTIDVAVPHQAQPFYAKLG
jgi:hypothetical protein